MAEREFVPSLTGTKGDIPKEVPLGEFPDDAQGQESERETMLRGKSRYEECRNHKHVIARPEDWKRYAMVYGDQQWDSTMHEDWQSTPTINMTFAAVNAILPILTDNKPQIMVVPREPDDDAISDTVAKVIEWIWEARSCDVLLPKTMLNTLLFGNGFWKGFWNPALRKGAGDIDVRNIDPTNVFFNPEATNVEDALDVFHVEQMPLEWIYQNYPDRANLVQPGVDDRSILVHRPHMAQKVKAHGEPVDVWATSDASTAYWKYPGGSASKGLPSLKGTATVYEWWHFDSKISDWVKTVWANQDALLEPPTPQDVETHPIIHFLDYAVAWTIWGTGEVQHVESLQYEINRRRGMLVDILRHNAMPMLVVDPASGVDHDSIKAKPNLVIPAEGGPSAVGMLVPQMDLAGLFALNDRDKQDFNDILGNVDIIQGKRPVGVEAGVALEILSESANTRLRLKVRLMEASLRRAGHILLKLMQKHYTTSRVFRIVGSESGPDGGPQAPEFLTINKPVGANPDGTPVYDETSNFIPPDAEFDVRIGAGSTLPVSKTARFQQAITLFDRDAIDQQELLRAANWPKWEEVLRRTQLQKMLALQAQQGVAPEGVPPIPGSAEELIGEPPPQEEASGGEAPV